MTDLIGLEIMRELITLRFLKNLIMSWAGNTYEVTISCG